MHGLVDGTLAQPTKIKLARRRKEIFGFIGGKRLLVRQLGSREKFALKFIRVLPASCATPIAPNKTKLCHCVTNGTDLHSHRKTKIF
jgi:hypothetical protein